MIGARSALLSGRDPWLSRRRTIAGIAAGLAAELALIGMRQYGVIRRLPDLPGFDSDAVVTSRAAYPLGIPDASLAVIGAGAIIALATAGGTRAAGRSRWHDLALGASVTVGAGSALVYLANMAKLHKVCGYCLVGTAGFLSLVPLVARGAVRALRRSP